MVATSQGFLCGSVDLLGAPCVEVGATALIQQVCTPWPPKTWAFEGGYVPQAP